MKDRFMSKWFLPTLALFTLTAISASGQSFKASAAPTIAIQSEEAQMIEEIKRQQLVGLSVAVVKNGTVVLSQGFGKTALEGGEDVTPETVFAIGSVTKQFVCACALMLAEESKFAVTDKVSKYFPNLAHSNDITVLDLMNHVSGYTDYYPLDFVDRRMAQPKPVAQVIEEYCGKPLDFAPGTKYSYSNTGYLLLGHIIEKVSGEPLGKFLSERIFVPLGMTHTLFEPATRGKSIAKGYSSLFLDAPEPVAIEGTGWIGAAGGILSTCLDLAKWDLALIDGKVLEHDSYKLMTSRRKLVDGTFSGYGCGLAIGERNGIPVLQHSGAVSGFVANNLILPESRSAIILLSNSDFARLDAIREKILPTLLPPPNEAAAAPKPTPQVVAAPPRAEIKLPHIPGPSAEAAGYHLFKCLQQGSIEDAQLSDEFAWYLNAKRRAAAKLHLQTLGEPTKVDVLSRGERGGMEVATLAFRFWRKDDHCINVPLDGWKDSAVSTVQVMLSSPGFELACPMFIKTRS